MGSMKKHGNTAEILKPFIEKLEEEKVTVNTIWVSDKEIAPCSSCFNCQNVDNEPGCSIKDDMEQVYEEILTADCIVFATPIYSWFCTAPMKAMIDRLFAINKYYGDTKENYGLLKGKKSAIIATCGYEIDQGADLFEEAIKRLSTHSKIDYIGMLGARDIDGIEDFRTKEAIDAAKDFAKKVHSKTNG